MRNCPDQATFRDKGGNSGKLYKLKVRYRELSGLVFSKPLSNAKPLFQMLKLYVKRFKRYANLYISPLLSTSALPP